MTGSQETIRVFVAVDVSPQAQQVLAQTIKQLTIAVPVGVRWVDPEKIHLTLKFLGDMGLRLVDDMVQAITREVVPFNTFRLELSGLGVFPSRSAPRVLWAGIQGSIGDLAALYSRVEDAASGLGFAAERRPFNPHLTLGRVRNGVTPTVGSRIRAAMETTSLGRCDPWPVDKVHLIRSALTPEGPIYSKLGTVDLTPASG